MINIDQADIKVETEDFFQKVGVDLKVDVSKSGEGFEIVLDTKESGLLIGYHGDTLQDFQTVLSLILNNKYKQEEWVRFNLDVGGWKQEREKSIRDLTMKAIEKVRSTGEPYRMLPMKPAERRIVHVIVGENVDIKSESSGVGADRSVVLSLAS